MSKKFSAWHKNSPFGLFIHWGVYSMTNYHEQFLMRMKAEREEYEKYYLSFNPTEYNPEEWVLIAKNNGMKYICFTTKHHDGFCLWNTKETDYNITNTPYKKDVLKMLQLACDKHSIDLCLYYSNPDWHHRNAYNDKSTHQIPPRKTDEPNIGLYKEFIKAQIKELLSNYGKIAMLFWDIPPGYEDKTINEFVREIQPDILINDRGYDLGDFSTSERHVPKGNIFSSPTLACDSIGRQSWGYRENEDYYSQNLLKQNIDKTIATGGNYLLNVGPTETGAISQRAKVILEEIGKWYHLIKESFQNTEPILIFKGKEYLLTTVKDNKLYIHFIKGLTCSGVVLNPITTLPKKVEVLNTGESPISALDIIPTHCQRKDAFVKYLHVYDLPCDKLNNEPVVLKLTFDKTFEIKQFCDNNLNHLEARFLIFKIFIFIK